MSKPADPILAYAVEIKGVEGDTVRGNLIELDYAAHVERMQKLTVPVETVAVSFKDDATFYLPFRSYRREAIPLEEKHGEVVSVSYLPENATELDMILRRERFKTGFHAKTGSIEDHIHKLAVQHGVTESLAYCPLKRRPPTMPSRKPIPKRLVCFAQNGYFEIYGEDAKKTAPRARHKAPDERAGRRRAGRRDRFSGRSVGRQGKSSVGTRQRCPCHAIR